MRKEQVGNCVIVKTMPHIPLECKRDLKIPQIPKIGAYDVLSRPITF